MIILFNLDSKDAVKINYVHNNNLFVFVSKSRVDGTPIYRVNKKIFMRYFKIKKLNGKEYSLVTEKDIKLLISKMVPQEIYDAIVFFISMEDKVNELKY